MPLERAGEIAQGFACLRRDAAELLRALAGQCTNAVERARQYPAERQTRARALRRSQLDEAGFQARSALGHLVECLQEGVLSIDRRGRVEFANSTAKHILSPAPLKVGRVIPEVWLDFPLRSFAVGLFDADERGLHAHVDSHDGKRAFDITGIPANRSETVILVVTDASEHERRLAAECEFVDNAAHELRSPLAAITSSVERLQAGAREVPEKRDRFLDHIQQESERLTRLTSSLLMLARAQARGEEPHREKFALRGLLEELVGGLELSRGVDVVIDCPPEIVTWSNRDLLERALLNLANNAARHTKRGRIRFNARVIDDGPVIIEISDTGCGIPPGELSRLFEPFYRGSGEEGCAGIGLGLPITKESVEAIGGRVEIDSVVGVGTTARIVLPAQTPLWHERTHSYR